MMGSLTGNAGIEVLPVVPVVRERLDKVGRELISMVRDWVLSGRVSLARLSVACGRDQEKEEGGTFIWKLSFCLREGGWEVRDKLSVITGERTETCVHAAVGPKELELLRSKGKVSRWKWKMSRISHWGMRRMEFRLRENLPSGKQWGNS
jgi:hypothetical protein